MIELRAALIPFITLTAASPAYASPQKCTPAEDLISAVTTIAGFSQEMTRDLSLDMVLKITTQDGGVLGERVFYRAPDAVETDLPIDADNVLTGTEALAGADIAGELCRAAPAGGVVTDKSSVSASMQFVFNSAGGSHDMDTIEAGLKSGRNQLKALAPAPARLLVPRLRYIVIEKTDKAAPDPVITALRGGAPLTDVPLQYYGGLPTLAVSDLKKARADAITIAGGAYRLLAMPKPGKDALSDTPSPPAAAAP